MMHGRKYIKNPPSYFRKMYYSIILPFTLESSSFPLFLGFCLISRTCKAWRKMLSVWGVASHSPNIKLEDCPFSVFRSCLFSVHNTSAHDLRTRHAVPTGCYCEKEDYYTVEQLHYFTNLFNSNNFTTPHCRFCSVEHLSLFLYMLKVVNNTTRYKKNVYSRY